MLFDYMFNDFENNLREMGFGDIAVNKKMKLFIRAFYGRLSQYSKSLDLLEKEDDKSLLEQTILNNIFKGNSSNKKNVSMFAKYIINNVERSYHKLFKFLKDVDELSLSTGKSININLIKKVLNR